MSTDLAFIGHLDSVDAYRAALEALRGPDMPALSGARVGELVQRMPPMTISDVALESPVGGAARAVYVDAFLLVTDGWSARAALTKVRAACAEAAASGARLGVLGGFTSIIGELAGFRPEREFGIPFTTGNTLTAAVIAEQAQRAVAQRANARIAVVGAAGDVGSGVCRILHDRGFRLLLVGRSPTRLRRLCEELPGHEICTWEHAAPRVDCAVLVASTAEGTISPATMSPHSLILDAGHPANAHPGGPARYARAGRVVHECAPVGEIPEFVNHGGDAGQFHACLVEGEVLALERRWESFSSGRGGIRPDRAQEILELARRHGIEPEAVPVLSDDPQPSGKSRGGDRGMRNRAVDFTAPPGARRVVNDPDALSRISRELVHKVDQRNVLLSRLSRVPGEHDVFESELVPDWTHPFFFEHLLDHVPSMMLVESGRQFAIAIAHEYFGAPRGAVFITTSYDIRFTDFAEVGVDAPVAIRAAVTDTKFRRGRLHSLRVDGSFSQGGRDLGGMGGTFVVFPRDIYIRLRRYHEIRRSCA